MIIASKQNARFKSWKKLLTKKERKIQQAFFIEGEHMVEEALKANWTIADVIQSEEYQIPKDWADTYPVLSQKKTVLSAHLFAELSETESPQGIALIVNMPKQGDVEKLLQKSKCILLVDQVQDPGNLGTIIRTADAAGIDAIILGIGTVDHFSGKVLRSTQGSIFHIPILETNLKECVPQLLGLDWNVYGTALEEAQDYRAVQIDQEDKTAIIVGNEGNGVDQELLQLVSYKIKIPIWGKAESLNVAIATGILLYHFQVQYK